MRKVLLGILTLSLSMSFLLFVNCEKDVTKPPEEPEVKLVSPVKNEVLIDSVKVEITATDDKGITQVEFIVDNEVAKTWIMSPYVYTWNVTAFSDSTDHLVYARAYDADGNVSTTPVVKVLVMLLSAPTNLSAQTVNDTQILLTWQDNSKIEDGFRIERKEEGGSYVQIAEVGVNVTSFDDSGLTYGNIYYYRVRAYRLQIESVYSNARRITMVIPTPSSLNATALDDQSVHLTWTDNCTFETGFRIERKEAGGSYTQIAEVSANVTNYDDVGLTFSETYIYRILAFTPNHQSDYSNEANLITIIDIDGNVYRIVKIGNQWWMVENLKATHYRNGDAIPEVTDNTAWENLYVYPTGAYCNYENKTDYVDTYGRLYNWYAVNDSHNIAPAGWHIPSDGEWLILADYLRGGADASDFSVLPGGYRTSSGNFGNMGSSAYFWSSTEGNKYYAYNRRIDYPGTGLISNWDDKRYGFSVRCVRD